MNGTDSNSSTAMELRQNISIMYENHYDMNNSDALPPLFPVPIDIEILDLVLRRILLPLTCIGGIVGTLLTVLVLSRRNMCTPINSYLKALAVTDLIFLTLLSTRLLEHYFEGTNYYERFHIYLAYNLIFCNLFNLVSIWLTVMLSIERYIAICHPLRVAAINGALGARTAILIIYITAFVCGLPKFWEIKVMYFPQIGPYIANGVLIPNKQYILGYRIFYEGILSVILPFFFLITINSQLIKEIQKSTRYIRHTMAADSALHRLISAEQLQLTLMLVGITFVFFLCHAPYLIYTIIAAIYNNRLTADHGRDMYIAFLVVRPVTQILIGIKSAIDFVLYCWFSEKFRVTFKRLFCMLHCLTQPQMRRLSTNNARRNSYHISKETTC